MVASFLVDDFEHFGLKQVYECGRRGQSEALSFKTPALYTVVRHPIYLGFIIAFWAAPRMTWGHLFFAAMCTGYILVAIQLEERDLINLYGESYKEYRTRVAMIIPFMKRKPNTDTASSSKAAGA